MDQLLQMPSQMGSIMYFIVLPTLLLVGLGYVLQRKFRMDMPTIVKLNFYVILPGIMFHAIANQELSATAAGKVVGFSVAMMGLMAVAGFIMAKLIPSASKMVSTVLLTVMFINAGNYGLPLIGLVFQDELAKVETAQALQVFVMLSMNLTTFTLGVLLASAGSKTDTSWGQRLLHIIKMPPNWAIVLALGFVLLKTYAPAKGELLETSLEPFFKATEMAALAFVAIALVTLGAQLAEVKHGVKSGPVWQSVVIRLVVAPIMGFGLVYLFGFEGLLAQVVLIGSALPCQVNSMLLAMEFNNHADYVAKSVFYSTILSPIPLTVVIFVATSGVLPGT